MAFQPFEFGFLASVLCIQVPMYLLFKGKLVPQIYFNERKNTFSVITYRFLVPFKTTKTEVQVELVKCLELHIVEVSKLKQRHGCLGINFYKASF